MHVLPLLAPAACLLLLAGRAVGQQTIVAVDNVGRAWTIDATTAVPTLLGATGAFGSDGMAAIADRYCIGGGGPTLHELDLATGGATAITNTLPWLGSPRALAFGPDGVLWAIENGGGLASTTVADELYRIDLATGAATAIGNTSPFTRVEGLAFGPGGVLYGWDLAAGLVRIDPATAATTDVAAGVGAPLYLRSLAWSPRGVMYGAGLQLATIDLATGVPTQVGTTTLLDMRGIEVVDAKVVLDNGPVRTHRTLGAFGKDLSMLQTNLGLTAFGFGVDVAAGASVLDEFMTDGPITLEGVDLFVWERHATAPSITAVHLELGAGTVLTGIVPVAGSPAFAQDLRMAPGYTVSTTMTDTFRAPDTAPVDTERRIQRVSVRFATPLSLDSAQIGGSYWLRVAFAGTTAAGPFVPPVTTVGLSGTGNALRRVGTVLQPLLDAGHHALPFVLRGARPAPPGGVTRLAGGCLVVPTALDISGATVAGGSVVHRLHGGSGLRGFVFGTVDANVPLLPCSCVLHPSLDFVVLGSSRYDLVAPPGIGTGFEYYVQGIDIDFTGGPGFPCSLVPPLQVALTDAAKVRFW